MEQDVGRHQAITTVHFHRKELDSFNGLSCKEAGVVGSDSKGGWEGPLSNLEILTIKSARIICCEPVTFTTF